MKLYKMIIDIGVSIDAKEACWRIKHKKIANLNVWVRGSDDFSHELVMEIVGCEPPEEWEMIPFNSLQELTEAQTANALWALVNY